MAATYTSIPIDSTAISVIKAALTAKSLITTVFYETTSYLIFSTPLTSKVIKLGIGGSFNSYSVYYGDAWASTSTITNPIAISIPPGAAYSIHMVADTTYFMLGQVNTSTVTYQTIIYFGAFDSGDQLAVGLCVTAQSADYANHNCRNITDGTTLMPIFLTGSDIFDPDSNLYKYDIVWKNNANGKLELNGSTPAKAIGFCATTSTATAWFKGPNYLLSPAPLYNSAASTARHQLLFEFE